MSAIKRMWKTLVNKSTGLFRKSTPRDSTPSTFTAPLKLKPTAKGGPRLQWYKHRPHRAGAKLAKKQLREKYFLSHDQIRKILYHKGWCL